MIIGLDVGGTHADAVLLEINNNKVNIIKEIKVPTDSSELFSTILTCIGKITAGIDKTKIKRLVLSTTLTTNAIVQDKISKSALIIISGPGVNPEYFQIGANYFIVNSGSIDHRGREITQIDAKEIDKIAQALKEKEIKYVGVVGKFSVRNSNHEIKVAQILSSHNYFEKIFLGHQVSGNLNFPRRICATYLNTIIYPIHKNFFEAVKSSLAEEQIAASIYILKADGGTMSLESSLDFPAQAILSGPSASVMGAIISASKSEDTLVLDIGGTTTDMAILVNGVPLLEPLGITLGTYKTLIRALDTHSIGIGGDSALRVINQNLEIGPDRIGPAVIYGGKHPTPTDALAVLGIIQEGDKEKARQSLEDIAKALNLPIEATAQLMFDKVCRIIIQEANNMIERINSKPVYTISELKEGYKTSPKKILILGGPAPFFAKRLEELSGIQVSVVERPNVANAIGAALARTTCEVTLFADTQRAILFAPEENFSENITRSFSREAALKKAFELLRKKALKRGASDNELEMEVVENTEFNMVSGFYTAGRNIRIKVQVKPGLLVGN